MNRLIIQANQDYSIQKIINKSTQCNDILKHVKQAKNLPSLLETYLSKIETIKIIKKINKCKIIEFCVRNLNFSLTKLQSENGTPFYILIVDESLTEINALPVNDYLANIIRYSPGYMYLKNRNFEYILCNENFAKAAGLFSADQITGKTDYELAWGKTEADLFRRGDIEALSGIEKINFIETQLQSDGKTRIVLANKVPLYDSNKVIIGILGNYLDITEQKKLETALEEAKMLAESANEAKTEFLENMRHDIRTPLTGIVGFSEIMKTDSNDPHIKECADNLVASSHALLELLDEILEAIRVSSGEIPKLNIKFNIEAVLKHIIDLTRSKAAHKNLTLSLDIDKSIPSYVIGDKIRFHRIILELIANALNFTDSGFVRLSAALAKRENQKIIFKFIIEDSGIGIPKDKQQDIYLQFKRLTASYRGIYKGAGLGLYIIKKFIEDLGGEIYVKSEPKKGSQFTCIIPFKEPLLNDDLGIDNEADHIFNKYYETTYAQQIKPPIPDSRTKEYKVLVVEDNQIAQSVAKSILAQLNCAADIAENGRNAVDMWKANTYDLIFMDIGLPDIDGYEVSHLIRVQELALKTHLPIIALTAHAGDENKKRCIDAGMNAVLTKPLTAKSCADIVNAFIPGRKKTKETSQTSKPSLGPDLPNTEDELFNLSTYPTLDIKEGIKTTGDEAMLTEMLRMLVEGELQSDVEKMKSAFSKKDFEKTQELAHKIKGGAVYVGTVKMKMACQYLERYWKAGHRDLFEKLYEQALEVIETTIHDVSRWLESK